MERYGVEFRLTLAMDAGLLYLAHRVVGVWAHHVTGGDEHKLASLKQQLADSAAALNAATQASEPPPAAQP
jgi:hypothetical protein